MKEIIFEITEFYCEIHKGWHRKNDDQFSKCTWRGGANYSFKFSKREVN